MKNVMAPHAAAAPLELDEVLERVTDGIVACDRELRFSYANAAAERLLALPRAELVGRRLADVYADLQPVAEAIVLEGRTNERASKTFEHVHLPSGRCFRHTTYSVPGGGLVTYFRDITERKHAAAALGQSEERYRALFESMDEGVCVIEVLFDAAGAAIDYRFLEVNPSFERQTGLVNATGKRMRELVPTHEEHWFRIYGDVARTGQPVRFENRAKALDRWYDTYAFRIGHPALHRVAVLFNDVSERKLVEQTLKEADRRKDEFLAILAHELRNPLAPLRNGLEIMRLARDDAALAETARAMMERQINHMVALVDDLLDVSRISRGLVSIERKRIELADVIHGAVEAAEPAVRKREHELTVHLPAEQLYVDADLTRLTQALGNLLLNAAKYTDRRGRISLHVKRLDSDVSICVSDTGIGIPREMLTKVFDLFTQVEASSHRAQGGLGIGLTIVKQIVEMHGGTVEAQSEGLGLGSQFIVRLPLAPEPHADDVSSRGDAAARHKARSVLVADDNRDAAESLALLLQLLGHEVRIAFDGPQAVEHARHRRPELILLDLGMPEMDGFEVARRIRALPEGGSVMLVAVTGWGQDADRAATAAAGFDNHLVKPIELAALEDLLRALDHCQG